MVYLQRFLPLLLGAFYPLGFSPINFPALALLSVLGLLLISAKQNAKQAAYSAWAWGFSAFGVGLSWIHVAIHDIGGAPLWLSALLTLGGAAIMGLFVALPFYLLNRFFKHATARFLVLAPLWLLSDYLRAYVLTGFPWLYLGYSQTDTVLARLAPLGSVYLISFIVVFFLGLVAWLFAQQKKTIAITTLSILVLVSSWPVAWQTDGEPAGDPIKAALLQPNIEQRLRWEPEQMRATAAQYREMTASVISDVNVVIWSEGAIPVLYDYLRDYFAEILQGSGKTDAALMVGVFTQHEGKTYNAALGLGAAQGEYAKRHLVPFGEYVPFEHLLRGVLAFFDLPMSGLQPGTASQRLLYKQQPVLTAICYETTYPELVRDNFIAQQQTHNAAPSWLLTISNDGWYGDSWGPKQHLQIVRMRAQELGLPVLRATPTGLTVAIDHNGRVINALPAFESGILKASIQPQKTLTPWVRWGMWPVFLFAILLTSFAIALERLKAYR